MKTRTSCSGPGRVPSAGVRILLFSWCFALAARTAPAQSGPQAVCGPLVAAVVEAKDGAPGCAVAVGAGGKVAWSAGYGVADAELGVPVGPGTKFRIASVSKPVTAAAVGLLVEAGSLDLDAPVRKYVPSFPDKGDALTTRLAAGHLAGIRHYRGAEFLSARRYATVVEALGIFQDDPLLHPPGAKFLYSSYGWNLVSAAVEGAAGRPFLDVMQERVFDPLGMRDTIADWNDRIIPGRARCHRRRPDGTLVHAPPVDNSNKWAGGGFLSTAEDLARFALAHARPGFLKAGTLDLLFTSQRTSAGEETGYGIGWRSGKSRTGRRQVSHSGGACGGSAFLLLRPEDGVAVALLANLEDTPGLGRLAERIADAFAAPH